MRQLSKDCFIDGDKVVFSDETTGENEFYMAYLGEPTFPQFSRFT